MKNQYRFGKITMLGGMACQHIGFSTDERDWQLWVSDDQQVLPKKFVITYKQESLTPQYTAVFSHWKLNPHLSDNTFTFTPPKGASESEMLTTTQATP